MFRLVRVGGRGVMVVVTGLGLCGRRQRIVMGTAVQAERVGAAAQEEQQDAGGGDQSAGQSGKPCHAVVNDNRTRLSAPGGWPGSGSGCLLGTVVIYSIYG